MRVLFCLWMAALLGACSTLPPAPSEPTRPKVTAEMVAKHVSADFSAAIASEAGEREAYEKGAQRIAAALALAQAGTPDDAGILPSALAAVGFFNRDFDAGRTILLAALPTLADKPAAYQRGVLSTAHQLYAVDAAPWVRTLLPQLATPREFAIAAYVLLRASDDASTRSFIQHTLSQRFGPSPDEPRLIALADRLATHPREHIAARPPLADLFAAPIKPGVPVVFSIQRPGRNVMGLAIVRGADGNFIRNADGRLFAQAQLARATIELPGTITNGHTPRGVFTIVGLGTAKNIWIGPTPYLHSKLPFEATPEEFDHALPQASTVVATSGASASAGSNTTTWSLSQYQSYLPPSWRNYFPMQEAWLAGRAGRDEIILHGTTINSAYYQGASFFPGTPSAGCLVSMETWDKASGTQLTSDQLTLAKAFTQNGHERGYLVVVEIDEGDAAVSLEEVLPHLPSS